MHTGSVAEQAEAIEAAGAEIVWVLEQDRDGQPGTAQRCMDTMDAAGTAAVGWCVGDEHTWPRPGAFDDSPFSQGRGFDMIVPRSTMRIAWVSNHGSPSGNENLSGVDVLAAVQDVISGQ